MIFDSWIFLFLMVHHCSHAFGDIEVCENVVLPEEEVSSAPTNRRFITDSESGCRCLQNPGRLFCFGHETCWTFPKHLNVTVAQFTLKATSISTINIGDLEIVKSVVSLNIDENYNLTFIEPGVFKNLTKLTNLSISFNPKLSILQENTFEGLVNLQELYLIKNFFTTLKVIADSLRPSIVPKLLTLHVNDNKFESINNDNFLAMNDSPLTELNIEYCFVEDLESESFSPLNQLKILNLGGNQFTPGNLSQVLRKMSDVLTPLQFLDLHSMGFIKNPPRHLLEVIAESNISYLGLAYNQFEIIDNSSFPPMPNIETLDLRHVKLFYLAQDAFDKFPKLATLFLSKNRLSSIPGGQILTKLRCLDLRKNSGRTGQQKAFTVSFDDATEFVNTSSLEVLNLSFNVLQAIYSESFVTLSNLKALYLENGNIYRLYNNSFKGLFNLQYLNLNSNYISISNYDTGLEASPFVDLISLKYLLIANCNISRINIDSNPFETMPNLIYLDLNNNKIMTLDSFGALFNLKTLILSFNSVQSWEIQYNIPTNLRRMHLASNKLILFTQAMSRNLQNLSVLDLTDNPFSCDCSWFLVTEKINLLIRNQSLACISTHNTQYILLEKYKESNEHSCKYDTLYNVLSIVLGVGLLSISIALLVFCYRWHLKYCWFLTRQHLIRRLKIKPPVKCSYDNYFYDVFVSYSNEDQDFVNKLVQKLEENPPFLKLCMYERDFEIGTIITENILQCLCKSRKTLLVISDSYARSQWCRWESQIAEHHMINVSPNNQFHNGLVLIKLSDVKKTDLTPTLNYIMKTRVYLEWSDDVSKHEIFWTKLRNILAVKDADTT